MFIILFVQSPLLIHKYGLNSLFIPTVVILLLMALVISLEYYFIHRNIYPKAKEERITDLLKMVLCPPTAIRASDLITSKTLFNIDPLILAHILQKEKEYEAFAQKYILDLKYPINNEINNDLSSEIISWNNSVILELSVSYYRDIAKANMNIFSAPKPYDSLSKVYCPRCMGQFITEREECSDCPGVKLVSLSLDKRE